MVRQIALIFIGLTWDQLEIIYFLNFIALHCIGNLSEFHRDCCRIRNCVFLTQAKYSPSISKEKKLNALCSILFFPKLIFFVRMKKKKPGSLFFIYYYSPV